MNYFVWMALALSSGLGVALFLARQRGLLIIGTLDTALVALVTGTIGARAGYVILNWAYFYNHSNQAVQWWRGGLYWHSGFILGLIGAIVYARHKQLPVAAILDVFAPGLAIGCAFGWLACYSAGCAYGAPVWPDQALWFLGADLPDEYGIYMPRVAVQLLGAGYSLLVACCLLLAATLACPAARPGSRQRAREQAAILWITRWSLVVGRWPLVFHQRLAVGGRPARIHFALFVCLYSAGMFILGFLRGDAAIIINGLRLEQWIDTALAITAAYFAIAKTA